MLRNYLAAALRNLLRNRAYAAINICGLALGFAAVILIALFVRDEYSFDRSFPDHERVYRVTETIQIPGQAPFRAAVTSSIIAAGMKLEFTEVEAATRLAPSTVILRRGDIESSTAVYWADPNFLDIFPLRVLVGNPAAALSDPGAIVLTRKIARRIFGREDVVGETLQLNRDHVMHVTAVLEDLPANTHLNIEVLAPGSASFSELTALDSVGSNPGEMRRESVYTYIRLKPGARVAALQGAMRGFVQRYVPGEMNGVRIASAYTFNLIPLPAIHLEQRAIADMKPPGDAHTLQAMIGIAALILFVAGSNFVSMMTARAARRAVEVGVRKAVGATRRQIVIQFLGECLFYAALALALALLAVELLLPTFNAFLDRAITFDYLRDPGLGLGLLALWALVGLAAGAYPALVLSRFRPSAVLKGVVFLPGGSGRLRQALVVFQFGTLIALIVGTLTIHRQTLYAMEDRLRLPTEQIYVGRSGCPNSFMEPVTHVPGVLAVSCASGSVLAYDRFSAGFASTNGSTVAVRAAPVDYGLLELFAVTPLAGRLFAQDRGEDDVLRANPESDSNPSVVINETAARSLGYSSPAAAVNQERRWARTIWNGREPKLAEARSSRIIGVIPDFSIGSVRDVIEPTVYYVDPSTLRFSIFKLDGHNIPESLRAVKTLWARQAGSDPLEGMFLSQYVNDLYADIQKQSAIFSAFSCVAVVVASLGLLGLAVFTAERRTREIGLRKVMGASRWDILGFLAWQFARPVLWANLVAWPFAYMAMQRWLEGFAYHVSLSPLVFVASSLLALIIALATVSGHALVVARAKPVEALRYE